MAAYGEGGVRPIRPNRVKRRLAAGETVCIAAGFNTSDEVDIVLGPLGFDGVWLEAEHGPVDFGDIGDLTRACDVWGTTPAPRALRPFPCARPLFFFGREPVSKCRG
jgi:hypothetical protein